MDDETRSTRDPKRAYTQLLRLHAQLLGQLTRVRNELAAPGTDTLVKRIKGQTGTEPDLSELKTSVEEAIKALKHVYMNYCDLGYPPDRLGPLFADDAVWESEIFGRHEGRDASETFFGGISSSIVFAAHLALNGVIDVDGDSGTGHWRLLMPCTLLDNGDKVSRWMLGDYEERYIRINGTWLFKHVNVFMNFTINWNEGWEKVAAMRP